MARFGLMIAGGVALVALAGCHKKEADAPPPPMATSATPEAARSIPARKPGLWEQTIAVDGAGAPMVTRVCLDPATDAKLSIQGQQMAGAACTEQSMTKTPDGYNFSSTCSIAKGGTVTSVGSAAGDFNSSYTVNVSTETKDSPVAAMNRASKMTIAAKWQGPCPADWAPGDVELPGGTRVNSLAIGASAAAAAK